MYKNFGKKNYVYFGQYKMPLIYSWLLQKWADNQAGQKYGLPKLDGKLLLLDGHLFIYKKDWETIEKWAQKIVKEKNEKSFKAIFRLMEVKTNKMLIVAKQLQQSKGLRVDYIYEFFKTMNQMEYPWFFILPMNDKLEKIIKGKLSVYDLPENNLQLFFTPHKPTLLMQQKRDIVNIKKELAQNKIIGKIKKLSAQKSFEFLKAQHPKIHQKIKRHISKYKWFGMMHMWGEPFSGEKFLEQLKSISVLGNTANKKITKLPKELKWLQKQTQELSYWRNYVAEICGVASYMALRKFEEGAKSMKLTYNMVWWFSPQEFLDGLQGKKIPSKQVLKKREKAFGLIIKKGEIIILIGDELKKAINFALERVFQGSHVKGIVANPGKARGVAKIILSPHEIDKVNKGDVMIAPATAPDFVPAAYRAAALVTDIGGITSHAAIMSREIGLPCIIGTKNATRIFKDGDFVEVDANKGMISKLKN